MSAGPFYVIGNGYLSGVPDRWEYDICCFMANHEQIMLTLLNTDFSPGGFYDKIIKGGAGLLSEERIRKMIRLSDYEKGFGSTDLRRTHYWKMDYVRLQVLKTLLAVLVSMVLILLLIALCNLEYVMQHVLELPYWEILVYGGSAFLIAEIAAVIVTVKIAGKEYEESKSRVKEYYKTLRELEGLYEEEEGQEEEAP